MCSKFESLSNAELMILAHEEAMHGGVYQCDAAFALADRGIVIEYPGPIDPSVWSLDEHFVEPNPDDTTTQSSAVVAQNVLKEPRADSRPLVSCMAKKKTDKALDTRHVDFSLPEDASSQSVGSESEDEREVDRLTEVINKQWNS